MQYSIFFALSRCASIFNVSAIYGNQREFTYHISHNSHWFCVRLYPFEMWCWTRSHCYFSKRTHKYSLNYHHDTRVMCVAHNNRNVSLLIFMFMKKKMSCRIFCSCLRAWEHTNLWKLDIFHFVSHFTLTSIFSALIMCCDHVRRRLNDKVTTSRSLEVD